ncbi:hypothetical protein EON83_17295 [bacterium]|nr:MAG: hypothetical protein EON83_17295 [bacterium]
MDLESKAVSGTVEHEAARVAVTFGVGEWKTTEYPTAHRHFGWGSGARLPIDWIINFEEGVRLTVLSVGSFERCCQLAFYWGEWDIRLNPKYDTAMARGLYCLGFEDEAILSQLPPLSAHEKLELRLGMPREFWPQKWLDEAG